MTNKLLDIRENGLPPENAPEELCNLVVLLLAVHISLALHPGDLDDAALADERQVAVPGIVGAQEGTSSPLLDF